MAGLSSRHSPALYPRLARPYCCQMVSADCSVHVPANCDFTIYNIPFGVLQRTDGTRRPCSAIGDFAIDLLAVAEAGLFRGSILEERARTVFGEPTLNAFMELGRPFWRACRETIQSVLHPKGPLGDPKLREAILVPMSSVTMVLPIQVGDYTDFYSSKEHATNVGIMFRGKDNALQPNYLHLPVGYHGRSSSVVVSGTPIVRPCGQLKPPEGGPVFGPTRKLDFELEMVARQMSHGLIPSSRPLSLAEATDLESPSRWARPTSTSLASCS